MVFMFYVELRTENLGFTTVVVKFGVVKNSCGFGCN